MDTCSLKSLNVRLLRRVGFGGAARRVERKMTSGDGFPVFFFNLRCKQRRSTKT